MTSRLLIADPSVGGPTFKFGDGGVANYAATFFPGQGETSTGPASQWFVSQWSMVNTINPANVIVDGGSDIDPVYGAPRYDFTNADHTHDLAAYQKPDGTWVYGLTAINNSVGNAVGGANLFLSTSLASPITLDHTVNYQVDLRQTLAVHGTAPAFAFTGFTLNFNVAGSATYTASLPTISMFLQIDITDSRGKASIQSYNTASVSADGKSMTLIAGGIAPGDPLLDFAPQSATYTLAYSSLNVYMTDFLQHNYLITQASGASAMGTLNPAVLDLARWSLGGVYIGTEDNGTGPVTAASSQIGLQVSHLLLSTTDAAPTAGGSMTKVAGSDLPVAQTAPVVTPAVPQVSVDPLAVHNMTSNQTVAPTTQTYSGPVASLQQQYINMTPDNLNITATTPGWFIHSGSGTDAISVSSGNNVVDGGTGSNFLSGGSGSDTFFIDDRGASSDIWSTVANFHAGDIATFWGVDQSHFSIAYADGQGAAGYTGLTLHATAAGAPQASLTLAGYSQADLSGGFLSVSFGTDTASGSAYMLVKGNS